MVPLQVKKRQMDFIAKMMNYQNVSSEFIDDLTYYAVLHDHFYDLARAWVCEPDLNKKLRIVEILDDTFTSIKADPNFGIALKNKNIL
jgi:hypothetical protein